MSTRQGESENDEARQSSADGATATLPRDTNADDTEPGAGDQDIDTAGTEADELSVSHDALGLPKSDDSGKDELMADQDPNQYPQDRNLEVPGDTNSPDIVGRTGEQMPKQSHDGLEDERNRDARSTSVNDEEREQHSPDSDTSADGRDKPRTERISDWP